MYSIIIYNIREGKKKILVCFKLGACAIESFASSKPLLILYIDYKFGNEGEQCSCVV